MKKIERVRRMLLRDLSKIISDLEQLNRDVNAWNGIHSDKTPIDCESNRLALAAAKACWIKVLNRQNCRAEWQRMMTFMKQE